MNIQRLILGIALAVVLTVAAAPSAMAAGKCFCSVEGTGATETNGASDAATCQTLCAGVSGSVGYLWAADTNQYPGSRLQCYSNATQCANAGGTWDTKQPAECLPGSHYCYPSDTASYTLQVSIPSASGDLTSVTNYGDYVAAVYKYLVGFSVTVAIVFLMIGGIRYVIGASTGEIGKAKDMIVKAITGLVLLLFAYVILFTVNPELVKLKVPKLPMMKAVQVLDGDDCATVLGLAFGSTPTQIANSCVDVSSEHGTGACRSVMNDAVIKYTGSSECGTTAEVIKLSGGTNAVSGTTCDFAYCEGVGTGCVDQGEKSICTTCEAVTANNDLGLEASAATCGAFRYPTQTVRGKSVPSAMCVYAFDLDLVDIEDAGLSRGACGMLEVNCNGLSECFDYNSMSIVNEEENGCAAWVSSSAPIAEFQAIAGGGRFDLSSFCGSDYCGLAPPGESCAIYQYDATGAAPICANSSFNGQGNTRVDQNGAAVSFSSRLWDLIVDAGSCQFN